jgi:hypothetical protein
VQALPRSTRLQHLICMHCWRERPAWCDGVTLFARDELLPAVRVNTSLRLLSVGSGASD